MTDTNPFAQWRPQAQKIIENLRSQTAGVTAIVVSSEDGFEVASIAESEASSSRIAAMASSMSALGGLAAQESGLGASRTVLMEAEAGLVVMVQAFHAKATLTVTTVADKASIMGQVLFACRGAARELESL